MEKARFLLAAALVLILANLSHAFEIAIYGDPLSYWNNRFLWDCRFADWQGYDRDDDSAGIFTSGNGYRQSQMDSVYEWYGDMGVTKVMVIYPYLSNFAEIPQDCTDIKVMNWYYPGQGTMHGAKYVDAQFRDVQVGLIREDDPDAYWSYRDAIGSNATRTDTTFRNEQGQLEERPVVAMSGAAGVLWKPTSYLGNFSGWDWYNTGWLDSSIYMPMHFKLTWAVDPNGSITTETPLADFYWIVRAPNDTINEQVCGRWWRFPAKSLTLNSLADTVNWMTSEFVDSSNAGYYNVLDDSFTVLDSIPWCGLHYGPTNRPRSLDDTYLSGVSFGLPTEVRMAVNYRGTHSFYLNRIEVYDDGAWRMFAAPESLSYANSIASAFDSAYGGAISRSAGWYYDEWDLSGGANGFPVLRSIVKVNKILQSNNLPTIFINGYSEPNDFFTRLDADGVEIPVWMNEFYFLGAATFCQPGPHQACGWPTPLHMWTSFASDTTHYIYAERCSEDLPNGQFTYEGYKSLQCTIDGSIWDWQPIFEIGNMQTPPCYPYDPFPHWFNLRPQVELRDSRKAGGHDEKFWALLCGNEDTPNDSNGCCPVRTPSPNEIKLMAWLAVACDVDGIMWYPWNFGGLLDWTDTTHTQIQRTDRYFAAKEACNDILRVTPILESLTFVKTYASRAFELDYPDATYAATAPDTLSTQNWCGNSIRAVQAIRSYEPCTQGDTACFLSYPEDNSYVQVSRFRNRHVAYLDPNIEDYWFLVVNRRALGDEYRKIELDIPVINDGPYYVRYVLGDSTKLQPLSANRETDCHLQTITLILRPGEAEFIHFTRGENGCQDASARVDSLTAMREGEIGIRLRWEEPTLSVDSLPFTPQTYFILRSCQVFVTTFDTIAFTETITYLDTMALPEPKCIYMVHACGTITERPGQVSSALPDKPKKERVVSEIVPFNARADRKD